MWPFCPAGQIGGMMDYSCVTTLDRIKEYLAGAAVVAFDFETSPMEAYRREEKAALNAHKSTVTGVSFSVSAGSGIYVPLRHKSGRNIENPEAVMASLQAALFENAAVIKVAHNLSFEAMFLYALGMVVQAPVYDTIAASQLTLKSAAAFRNLSDSGLKTLVPQFFGVELPDFATVTDGRFFDELSPQDAETVQYACADSDFALRLYHLFNGWFDRYLPRHRFLVEQVESPAAVYCGIMRYNGILMDQAAMEEKQAQAQERLAKIREEIAFLIGDVEIGANASTSAFKNYLYKDLDLPVLKTTAKYQEAADDEAMILLADWCRENRPELTRLFELVQEYRRLGKIKGTYLDGYLRYVNNATGRIHPDLLPLGTETGRFASRNPNMQNCFDGETEILTKRGFVLFSELKEEDVVAQWEDGEIRFVSPLGYVEQEYNGEMVEIHNQHIDLCMTPEHRCLLQDRKTLSYTVVPAEDYRKDMRQLQAARFPFGKKHLSAYEVTLLAATQADGHIRDNGIDFSFMKARKYRRLLRAIQEGGIPYSDTLRANGQVRIRLLKSPVTEGIIALLGERKSWGAWLLDYDLETVEAILAELPEWDGCFTRRNHYSSSLKENADWMQILYSLTGKRAHLRAYDNGNPNAALNYQVDVTDRDYSLTANARKTRRPYSGKVYCVTVPSGFIMVRRNGQVCITGNCPRKGSDPVGIRSLITAPAGCVVMELDYSQVELRVGAFYCRDEKMLETYKNGGDIHAQTTSVIYHIPMEQAADKEAAEYKERRSIAKNCNFGCFYGLFPKGLQKTLKFKAGLDTSLKECEQIIANLKSGYAGLSVWQEQVKRQAAAKRYCETWLGRRRYLPGIISEDWGKKSFAERCAMNTPIQGTAADIIKLAMGRIVAVLREYPWLRPVLTVHDSLVFYLPEDRVAEAGRLIKELMERQPFPEFDVPLVAEAAAGKNYGELAELEVEA